MASKTVRPDRVLVSETVREVHVPGDTNQPVVVGQAISRTYQGENLSANFYISSKGQKETTFKPSSDEFHFVDHYDAVAPLINDLGYQVKRSSISRGGAVFEATLVHPDAPEIDDTILWDRSIWDEQLRRLLESGMKFAMQEMIHLVSEIDFKRAIRYTKGVWRPVCTNGMMALILGYPKFSLNHKNFSRDLLLGKVKSAKPIIGKPDDFAALNGKFIGTVEGVQRYADFIKHSLLTEGSSDDEEAGLNPLVKIPTFIEDAIKPMERLPGWYLTGFANQLEVLAGASHNREVYALDVINAITSPLSLDRRDQAAKPKEQQKVRSYDRINRRQSSIAMASARLIGAMSLN